MDRSATVLLLLSSCWVATIVGSFVGETFSKPGGLLKMELQGFELPPDFLLKSVKVKGDDRRMRRLAAKV
jgi:hypothetical protein